MANDPNPDHQAKIQPLIDRTLALAIENLHLAACCWKPELFVVADRNRLLRHIEYMADFIAKHAPSDLTALIDCPQCRVRVAENLRAAVH